MTTDTTVQILTSECTWILFDTTALMLDVHSPTGVSVTGATATTDPDRKGGSTGASMTSIATA